MLAATREPVSTMVVVCEVSAMESGDEGNSSGTGGTETGGADVPGHQLLIHSATNN